MKRKTAKELLGDSFRELAAGKTIDKITIRDIAQNCGYSSATFYRHFKDKYDVIAWDYARNVESILEKAGKGGHSWRNVLEETAAYYEKERSYLMNLFLHTEGYDSFLRNMTDINFESMKKIILRASGRKALEPDTEMLIRGYCSGTVNLTSEWLFGRYDIRSKELADIYEKLVPRALEEWLL